MPKNYPFVRDDVLPSFWANAIQEVISGLQKSVRLRKKPGTTNVIELVAGAGNEQQGLVIEGLWRYVTSTIERSHPGGSAGNYPIWAVTADNDITSSPDPFTDETDYSFSLRITSPGTEPTASAGVIDAWRQVGVCVWDGTAITRVETLPSIGLPVLRMMQWHTFTLPGLVEVPSGSANFVLPMRVHLLGEFHTARLTRAYGELFHGGANASVTGQVRRKPVGSAEAAPTGWSGLQTPLGGVNVDGSPFTPPAVTLADLDRLRYVVTGVANAPENHAFTIGIEHSVDLAALVG